ncbi:FAD-binding monooxygenase ktnD-like isoform X1 [Bradysia coprophila]|uniref:FAD-binding monooxygenase ktnD-like isoform X1 n=1 Tax=Bradysia coprophila TaxID=38358 RepID=UPI00187DA190|nr:FAD-binding monooxygenase ktnD-like isoform X1 [Bradysia coprophila]
MSSNCWSNGKPEIGIIGAGMSGLCAAVQLQKKLAITSFTIFEKNADVGGIWLNNTYPGCECDSPSHLYSFSFDLNPNWSANYAPQPEILDYVKHVAEKHKIYEHIKFHHEVKALTWNEDLKKWIVRYANAFIEKNDDEIQMFDIVVMAVGTFRIPCIPNELKTFSGPTMHTAEWNYEINLKNKKVAVIGSGASAVQVIPKIVNEVHTLHCYHRKPPYVIPRLQFTIPKFLKLFFFYIPFLMWLYRCLVFMLYELFQPAYYCGSFMNKLVYKVTKAYRQRELKKHEHLLNDLTPTYAFGCKRVTLTEGYYAAMTSPNVHLHSSHIDKIVDRTIYTKNGMKEEIDVLILATGFKVLEYWGPMQIFGKNSHNVLQSWIDKEPRSYYGIAFSSAPNLFALLGPNTVVGHNSVMFMVECQVNFMIKAVRKMMKRNAEVINLKVAAEDDFMDKLKANLKDTVWNREVCDSWFTNSRGVVTTLWGGNCTKYWRQTRTIDWSKFEIK